jgi:hypothetical protein
LKVRPSGVSSGGFVWQELHASPVCREKLGTASVRRGTETSATHNPNIATALSSPEIFKALKFAIEHPPSRNKTSYQRQNIIGRWFKSWWRESHLNVTGVTIPETAIRPAANLIVDV